MKDVDAIFSEINTHMIEGLMLHDQLYQFFLFLRLDRFSDQQKKRYEDESTARRKLNKYYISHMNKLIKESAVNASSIIPVEWFSRLRYDIQPEDIRKATSFAFSTWCSWENRTKELYSKAYRDLLDEGVVALAAYVLKLVKDVDEELAEAENIHLYYQAMNYDPIEIMEHNK